MKSKLIILSLVVLALLATSVSASLTFGNLLIGAASAETSNPNHDTESRRDINLTGPLVVTNNGTGNITNFRVSAVSAATGFTATDLNTNTVKVESIPANLLLVPGQTTQINIQSRMPNNLDAVSSNLIASAFKTATLTIQGLDASGNVVDSGSLDLNMQRKNRLLVDAVKWKVRGKSQTADEDNDKVENSKPGDVVRIEFDIENDYNENDNVDIEDVEFRIESKDSELDLDEDEDLDDISANDKESGTFEFEIDEDTNDGNYDVLITLTGRDEHGAKHGEKALIRFEVERESHEVAIKSVTLSPEKVGCEATNAKLVVSYSNIGKADEDQVAIEIDAPTLKFNQRITDIELNEDDGDTNAFNIPIPAGLAAGTYNVEVKTFYDQNKLTDNNVVVLTGTCEKGVKPIVDTNGKVTSAGLSLSSSSLNVKQGGSATLGVNVVNTGKEKATFTVDVSADWALTGGSKTVTLEPGASSSVVFSLAAKSSANVGQNSAVVEVKSGTNVLSSQVATVSVEAGEKITTGSDFFSKNSTAIWVIVDIVLIVIAALLIKVLFFRKKEPRTF